MIFGFNTDVKHGDTVYHVQSEARTHESLLETQVFVKGRCLGKRAASYAADQAGFSDEHIHELLKNQHKHFVAAAREGRIETEFLETPQASAPAAEANSGDAAATAPAPAAAAAVTPDDWLAASEQEASFLPGTPAQEPAEADSKRPASWSLHPVSAVIGKGLSFDCLSPVCAIDGSYVTVGVQVSDGSGPVEGAEVNCRITSAAGPASYVYAISGENGAADLPVSLDELDLATAAILIQASFRGKSASRKYQLRPE